MKGILPFNKLTYPGGWARPGVDYKHIALSTSGGPAATLVFSAVSTTPGMFTILNAAIQPQVIQSPLSTINAWTGPGIYTSSTTGSIQFQSPQTGNSVAGQGMTMAGIFAWDGGINGVPLGFLTAGHNILDFYTAGGLMGCAWNEGTTVVNIGSLPGTLINDGLFVAFSFTTNSPGSSVVQNWNGVARNLRTGVVYYNSGTFTNSLVTFTTNRYICIGNSNTGGTYGNNYTKAISTATIILNFLPLNTLRVWVNAPWDFWYPSTFIQSLKTPTSLAHPQARAWIMA